MRKSRLDFPVDSSADEFLMNLKGNPYDIYTMHCTYGHMFLLLTVVYVHVARLQLSPSISTDSIVLRENSDVLPHVVLRAHSWEL